jgi:hypothetical protein
VGRGDPWPVVYYGLSAIHKGLISRRPRRRLFSTLTALAANTTAALPDSAPMVVAITLVPATVADKWPAFVAIAVDETVEISCCSNAYTDRLGYCTSTDKSGFDVR